MKNEKIILYGAHAIPTIICLHLFNKLSIIIHMLLIYLEIKILFKLTDIAYYFSTTAIGTIVIILICLIPLTTHIIYLALSKFGYTVLYNDHAEIQTKTFKKSSAYYNSLTLESQKRSRIYSPKYQYYSVKMIFEENGEINKIHLYTDNPNLFTVLTEKFSKAN